MKRLTFANVVSCLALFVALSTGGAYAAATLTGADIVDGSLTGVDIQDESVKREDIAKNAIGTGKVIDGDLTGADVGDNSLTGADVDESTLGTVPDANTLGGLASSAIVDNREVTKNDCDPNSLSSETICGSLSLTPQVDEHLLLVGRFEWYADDIGGTGGLCRLLQGQTAIDVVEFGETSRTTSFDHPSVAVAVAHVDAPANTQTKVELRCRQTQADIKLNNIQLELVGGP
jgi:hypothetical protein